MSDFARAYKAVCASVNTETIDSTERWHEDEDASATAESQQLEMTLFNTLMLHDA